MKAPVGAAHDTTYEHGQAETLAAILRLSHKAEALVQAACRIPLYDAEGEHSGSVCPCYRLAPLKHLPARTLPAVRCQGGGARVEASESHGARQNHANVRRANTEAYERVGERGPIVWFGVLNRCFDSFGHFVGHERVDCPALSVLQPASLVASFPGRALHLLACSLLSQW